ncbi:MAG: formate dehydrogenase accessory sulfurtransferase FdhD [Spirochaetales bacterium]|uniref:Formate dehydrogenase accessory sulfurtransferase FdhD n=1 Tax=Candidatus Thalassospirochaeta sargassi TaxID=3119039 RepID=A0AAJ1ICX5_9SPIO|nr:formate dehydrogenase accessory sulfurtransferase FdhD [Spirochaetales bacterium]
MKISNHKPNPVELPIVDEVKFKLFINGVYYSDFLCTPESIEELVLGYLYTNCHISTVHELEKIIIKEYKINAELRRSTPQEALTPLKKSIKLPDKQKLRRMALKMFSTASIYKKHGGIHCSAFTDGETLLAFKEDIGRHNAYDKVVGELLMKELDPSELIYITSGRVNHEVMQKTLAGRIPAIVSRSICSSAAYNAALENGVVVIGRILEDSPIVYGKEIMNV